MPAASPPAASRPPACSPSLTKSLLLPPSSPLKKQGKARWIHTKTRIFAGVGDCIGEDNTGPRQSQWLIEALFFVVLVAHVVSCQIVLNIIKTSNKSSFVLTLFIIFAVFIHIEHDHIIEQTKKNEGK